MATATESVMALNAVAPAGTALVEPPLEFLSLYHAVDPYLSSVFIFYGPVATANATVSSSRIQAHIFTPAGFQSYPRITISPAAPLYAAVNRLPREKQGNAVARALAVSMFKYFSELSEPLRNRLTDAPRTTTTKQPAKPPRLFDEGHAADLASRMTKMEDSSDVVRDVRSALLDRKISWADIDVVLPTGTIKLPGRRESTGSDIGQMETVQYGQYTSLIQELGEPIFLPTSRLKRAPSQSTNVSKSKVFTRNQKEALRLAMCELVDTEERYVAKIYSLVHEVADEFRLKAQGKGPSSTSPDEVALKALFPSCLHDILDVNLGFLDVIRHILEETEEDALEDISQDTELPSSRAASRANTDPIGAVAFAKALLEWLPKFSQPYGDYMRAHIGFTQTLNSFMKDKNSSFSKRVYETGEQKLRSLLMEPVQRLPRYSLLIDTMTGSLPLVHSAVRPLLKARDIVKDICALDDSSPSSHAHSLKRLKELADGWPEKPFPEGRLITAVDFNEIPVPYQLDVQPAEQGAGIMLLYKNCLVLLTKLVDSRTTARGLLADIENAASSNYDTSLALPFSELKVVQVLELHTVRCMHSACGKILFLVPTTKSNANTSVNVVDLLALELVATYEGKASRLIEEVTKAKIEGRYDDSEREGGKWTLRSPAVPAGNTNILACVCEEETSISLKQPQSSKVRLVFDTPRALSTQLLSQNDLEVVISISQTGTDQFRMDMDSVVGSTSTDLFSVDNFVPTLSKRLQNLLSILHTAKNPLLVKPLVHSNFEIIRYLASSLISQVKTSRSFRPHSATKLLSNLLGGSRDNVPLLKAQYSGTLHGELPKTPPPRGHLARSNTLPSSIPGKENGKEKDKESEEASSKISVVGTSTVKGPDGQHGLLEKTFAAYVLSLQSRSGNILGRTLRARENADRALVNELYNILLEDSSRLQAAAEVPVDTLFVAFETFMKNAWKESMGSVLETSSLNLLQSQFDSMFPRDFDEQFRKFLVNTSPQNRRALAAIIRLLAELLDASGNDGDRGALTMAFAEVLTEDGDPVQHVSLLDRLVDDFDYIFEEFIPSGASVEGTLTCDQTKASNSKTGSVGSNSSSFRKRFGFGMHKDSFKHENESKVASILRTLSSKKHTDSDPSTSKAPLIRSKSTDIDTRLNLFRSSSRDRLRGFTSQEHISSGQPPSLSSMRGISTDGVVRVRRKRRSSLSDLRPTTASSEASQISVSSSLLRPVTPSSRSQFGEVTTPTSQSRPQSSYRAQSPARGPSASKATSPTRLRSPIRRGSPTRPASPSKKENIDPKFSQTEQSLKPRSNIPESSFQENRRRSVATGIPQRTAALRERSAVNGSDNKRPLSFPTIQKPLKVRMQSPQKLRDRVQYEKKSHSATELGIRDEISALGDELRSLKLDPTNDMTPKTGTVDGLDGRFRRLEERFDQFSGEYSGRASALERDLESSLMFSEKRAKKLDELYREASAENEALYDRFNSELSKISKDVRAGSGEDAMKSQLSQALDEIGRLKKENFRLKREVGGLRAQQAAVALLRASEQ